VSVADAGTPSASDVRPAGTAPPAGGRAGTARPRRRAAAVLRRHWLAAALLAAGLALRALATASYRPVLFYIDTPRYLFNAAPGMDPLGYAGVLRAILAAGNLDAVAVAQHLLGLAIAVALYALLLRLGASRWLAALAIAPLLLDAYQVQIEQEAMPDVLFEAMIVAGLAILLARPAPTWRRAAAAGLVLGASATVAQVGEALLPAAVAWLLAASGWRAGLRRVVALGGSFTLPILAYCTGSYLLTGSFFLSHTGVTSLYGRAAAAADCATLRLPPAERAMCPAPAQQARGPDWLEYDPASPVQRFYYRNPRLTRGQVDALITAFNRAVLRQQPLRVLAAYGRDVVRLFAPARAPVPSVTPISRWQFQPAYPYFPPWTTPRLLRAAAAKYGGGAPAIWRPGALFLRGYQLGGGYAPGPLLALLTVAGLAGSAAALRRRARRSGEADGTPGRLALACLLFFASGASVLLASDAFEFSWRYQLPALVTLVPAGALGLAALVTGAARRGGTARTP